MIATGEFAGDLKAQQRLVYTDRAAGFSIPVDLIPFRGVASANQMIAWPPSREAWPERCRIRGSVGIIAPGSS